MTVKKTQWTAVLRQTEKAVRCRKPHNLLGCRVSGSSDLDYCVFFPIKLALYNIKKILELQMQVWKWLFSSLMCSRLFYSVLKVIVSQSNI